MKQILILMAFLLLGAVRPIDTQAQQSEESPDQLLLKNFRPQSLYNTPTTTV